MKLGLNCFGQTLEVSSSSCDVLSYVSSLKRIHVFSISFVDPNTLPNNLPKLIVENSSTADLTFDHASRTMILRADWSRINKSGTLESLLGQLLDIACLDSGAIPIHASAISSKHGAYIFVGGSGAGKTSLSFSLCSQFGFRLIANDYLSFKPVRQGDIAICQGDDFIDFRKLPFPEMKNFLSNNTIEKIQDRFSSDTTPWTKSTPPFIFSDLDLMRVNFPCLIKGIFFPNISRNIYEFTNRLSLSRTTTSLLWEITGPVRGVMSFVVDNSGKVISPSVSLEPKTGWEYVCATVNTLADQCPSWAVHAPLKTALEFVHSQILDQEQN